MLAEKAAAGSAVLVPRRNAEGAVASDFSSLATKYHGFAAGKEYDVLAARHYGDNMLAMGFAMDWRETVIRSDILATQIENYTGDQIVASAVANISYSWRWFDKNVSGFLEYFYNGFGQPANDYSPDALANNSQLLQRIARGELYTLGKHYLGANIGIETTALTMLTTNLFVNMADPSALLQVIFNVDWRQNLTLLSGLSFPMGARGSEFGGIPSTAPGVYYQNGNSVFAQLAYFF